MLKSLINSLCIVVDGGCLGNGLDNPTGYGSFAVFVNTTKVRTETFDLPECTTNNQAEYASWVKAFKYIIDNPKRMSLHWTIKGDSKLVIDQITGKAKCKNAGLKVHHFLATEALRIVDAEIVRISGDEVKAILGH